MKIRKVYDNDDSEHILSRKNSFEPSVGKKKVIDVKKCQLIFLHVKSVLCSKKISFVYHHYKILLKHGFLSLKNTSHVFLPFF